MIMADRIAPHESGLTITVEELPRSVINQTQGQGNSPVCHGARWISHYGLFKAAHRLLVIKRVGSDEATNEPDLRILADGANRAMEVTKIIVLQGSRA